MAAIKEYEELLDETEDTPAYHQKFSDAMIKMDDLGAWDFEAKVNQILSKLKVQHLHQTVSTLSGGQRKRIALARTLIDIGFEHKHVLLVMDEPTNHLDIEMVEWLLVWRMKMMEKMMENDEENVVKVGGLKVRQWR